jgi:hypothetical protein
MNRHHHDNHWCANAWVGAPWACGDHHHHSKENYCNRRRQTKKCHRFNDDKHNCEKHYTNQKKKHGKPGGSYPCVHSKVTVTETGLPVAGREGHCGIDMNNPCSDIS